MPRRATTIVFHVGSVPTASWLVQQCLTRHASVWRPSTYGLPNAIVEHDIGSGDALVADPGGFATTLGQAFAEQGADVVVGSRELLGPAFGGPPGSGLHAEADEVIEAFAEATRSHRRVIVLSVCAQAQLLEMHYGRALAYGSTTGFEDWLASVDLENLSWLPLLGKLTAAFGSEAVVIQDFRRTRQGHVELLRDVLGAAGLELPAVVTRKTPSPRLRLSEKGVSLAIAANPHLTSNQERADLSTFLLRNFSELDGPPGAVLTDARSEALRGRYDRELARLRSMVLAQQSGAW